MREENSEWTYIKLYLGEFGDRADGVVVDLCGRMLRNRYLRKWFFLRYIDEGGLHVRVRGLACAGQEAEAAQQTKTDCAQIVDRLSEYAVNVYSPMVQLGNQGAIAPPFTGLQPGTVADVYAPETDKYGSGSCMEIAEELFHRSSAIGHGILLDEAEGEVSRKVLAPWLMHLPYRQFPSEKPGRYWKDYSLYWLGGPSRVADEWRGKFMRKFGKLREAGHDVLGSRSALPKRGAEHIAQWEQALHAAAGAYASQKAKNGPRNDVLSLNFSHLMMNRLGIATLEEAYLATLLFANEEEMA